MLMFFIYFKCFVTNIIFRSKLDGGGADSNASKTTGAIGLSSVTAWMLQETGCAQDLFPYERGNFVLQYYLGFVGVTGFY